MSVKTNHNTSVKYDNAIKQVNIFKILEYFLPLWWLSLKQFSLVYLKMNIKKIDGFDE